MRRNVVRLVLPLMLLTAACGTGDTPTAPAKQGTLADVTVSGPTDKKPTVDFKAPLSFATTMGKVVEKGPGKGDAVQADSVVTVDYVAINASDATEYDSTWSRGEPATFGVSQVIPGFAMGLTGDHAGDRVLIAVASKDGYDPVGNGSSIRKGDSLVLVVDVRSVSSPIKDVAGTKMSPPATVPSLVYDDQDAPTGFKATDKTPESVDKLGVYPVIKGNGPVVKKGQTIVVNYLGQVYPDGAVFDESYSGGQPVSFQLGEVIPGWTKGLVGQTVGSRVILVVPSADGYGAQGQGSTIPPDADLIFVIDLLQAY
ncbi:MAG: FKBP-type peptidyl-prolyl cis-trans isomerase [Propionibacteriales bacterium]|nr:FKBP-type peptidyl-prolyl cis-trans isomerase [Propionibacteriales bacterium]